MQNAPGSLSRSSDVVSGISSRNFDINPFNYALNTSRALRAYDSNGEREYYTLNFAPFNILEELDNNYIKLNVIDLKAQAEFNWQIFKGLKYNFTGNNQLFLCSCKGNIKDSKPLRHILLFVLSPYKSFYNSW